MALQSGREPSTPLEAIRLYSLLDTQTTPATVIAHAERVNRFVTDLAKGLNESLANHSRIHGLRAQTMFQGMIIGLGGVRLIKEEDIGEFFFEGTDGRVRVPDFRLVRSDGEHLLVEVKTVDPADQLGPHRLRAADVDALRRYADLTGARLLLAHYWTAWNLWTLADAAAFGVHDGKLIVDMKTAMTASELGLLGDAAIATVPPLTVSLTADPTVPPVATPHDSGPESKAAFAVGDVELSDVERRIAGFLMRFGTWKLTTNVADDRQRIDLVFAPEEPVLGQPFEVVGQLSSMYSAVFRLATETEDGQVLGLRHDVTPGVLADLVPSDYFDHPDRALQLWLLRVHPSVGPATERG
jgi:hypothetical protein